MSEAKVYLKRLHRYDALIKSKRAQRQRLYETATKITPNMSDDGGHGSGFSDKIGNAATKIADLDREIDKSICEYVDLLRAVTQIIERLEKPEHIRVLNMRYVECAPFKKIEEEMGMTERGVHHLHGRALQAFEKIMEDRK